MPEKDQSHLRNPDSGVAHISSDDDSMQFATRITGVIADKFGLKSELPLALAIDQLAKEAGNAGAELILFAKTQKTEDVAAILEGIVFFSTDGRVRYLEPLDECQKIIASICEQEGVPYTGKVDLGSLAASVQDSYVAAVSSVAPGYGSESSFWVLGAAKFV